MLAKSIITSDAFRELPFSAQALYVQLVMNADDDGFINSPKSIQRAIGAKPKDLEILINKRFLLDFESGVVVIKHWKINNYIQADRYKATAYQDELKQLSVKPNRAYTKCIQDVSKMDTECIQNGYTDKNRLDKYRLGEDNIYINNIYRGEDSIYPQHVDNSQEERFKAIEDRLKKEAESINA